MFIHAKMLLAAIFPKYFLKETIDTIKILANIYIKIAAFMLFLSIIPAAWGAYKVYLNKDLPTNSVSINDFSRDDFTGILNEVLLEGYIHLDKRSEVKIGRRTLTLAPFTDTTWRVNEPIKALVNIGDLDKYLNAEKSVEALNNQRLAAKLAQADQSQPIHIKEVFEEKMPHPFEGDVNVTEDLRKGGINAADNAIIFDEIEYQRDYKLKAYHEKYLTLRNIAFIFAGIFFTLGWLVKFRLRKF